MIPDLAVISVPDLEIDVWVKNIEIKKKSLVFHGFINQFKERKRKKIT